MDDKTKMLKGQLGKEKLSELAVLAAKCFIIKKEDLEKRSDQSLINEKSTLVADEPHFIPVDLTSDTTIQAEEPRRSFKCSFTLVDEQEERYNALMLTVCVLPVFSKSLLHVTLPHMPYQLREDYTTKYRNRHNFFYAAMRNLFSHSFSKKSEEEQLFERLEIAQAFGIDTLPPLSPAIPSLVKK